MKLNGRQVEQLSKIIRSAFELAHFDQMLYFRLDKNRQDIALGDDYRTIVFRTIRSAQREGWIDRLVLAAHQSRPNNPYLLAFAGLVNLGPDDMPERNGLEKIIVDTNSLLDIGKWREKLSQIEGRVCRVEIGDQAMGTGFLLGPSVVMTNYHVVNSVIEGTNGHKPEDIQVRFDYKERSDGSPVEGVTFDVAGADWLIDFSPYDEVDLVSPKPTEAAVDKLDYALLRLDDAPGARPIGGQADEGAAKRGFIELPATPYNFQPQSPLFIVQHPRGKPLKLALDTQAVVETNTNGTRVRYRTNTEPGSSGSPVFDQDWNLVALHHSGEPKFKPSWNEGIPLPAIVALLRQRNKLEQLNEMVSGEASESEDDLLGDI